MTLTFKANRWNWYTHTHTHTNIQWVIRVYGSTRGCKKHDTCWNSFSRLGPRVLMFLTAPLSLLLQSLTKKTRKKKKKRKLSLMLTWRRFLWCVLWWNNNNNNVFVYGLCKYEGLFHILGPSEVCLCEHSNPTRVWPKTANQSTQLLKIAHFWTKPASVASCLEQWWNVLSSWFWGGRPYSPTATNHEMFKMFHSSHVAFVDTRWFWALGKPEFYEVKEYLGLI